MLKTSFLLTVLFLEELEELGEDDIALFALIEPHFQGKKTCDRLQLKV